MIVVVIIAIISFNEFKSFSVESTTEATPTNMFFTYLFGVITVTALMIFVGAFGIVDWLEKKTKISLKTLFFKKVYFLVWFVVVSSVSIMIVTYYVYYYFPDFQYDIIFNVVNFLLVLYPCLFLARKVWMFYKTVRVGKENKPLLQRLKEYKYEE